MILLPSKCQLLIANIQDHWRRGYPSKGKNSLHKAEKACKINSQTKTAAVSIRTNTKWITRGKSEWLVQTPVSCLMHFHVALYLIIDHTGAALNRACLPHRYKQLNNSLASVYDVVWVQRENKLTVIQPDAPSCCGTKWRFCEVKWMIFTSLSHIYTGQGILQVSNRKIPILYFTRHWLNCYCCCFISKASTSH